MLELYYKLNLLWREKETHVAVGFGRSVIVVVDSGGGLVEVNKKILIRIV